MELMSLILIVLFAWLFFKLLGFIFNAAAFLIILPLKLLALGLASLLVIFVLVPLGLVAGLAGLILAPLAVLVPLLPFVLIGIGVYLLIQHQRRGMYYRPPQEQHRPATSPAGKR